MKNRAHISLPIIALSLLLLGVSACGFEPVYAKKNSSSLQPHTAYLSHVTVKAPGGMYTQQLQAELASLLNPSRTLSEQDYRLDITLSSREYALIVESDRTASRIQLDFTSPYRLVRQADGTEMVKGSVRYVTSYTISEDADFSTHITEQDARRSAMKQLALQHYARIASYFAGNLPTPADAP